MEGLDKLVAPTIRLGAVNIARYEFLANPQPKKRARSAGFGKPYKPKDSRIYEDSIARSAKMQHPMLAPFSGRMFCGMTTFINHQKADVDNYSKAILDSLQIGRVIKNDNIIDAHWTRRVKIGPEVQEGTIVHLRPIMTCEWLIEAIERLIVTEKPEPGTCPLCGCGCGCGEEVPF